MNEFLVNFGSWIWIGILVICCFIEAFTFGLTTIWAAISAIPLIFIAKTGLAFQWQVLIFAVLTVILSFLRQELQIECNTKTTVAFRLKFALKVVYLLVFLCKRIARPEY